MSDAEHSVPGQVAGFIYQFERALFRLVTESGTSAVGVETEDDVAAKISGKTARLEQDKHSTKDSGHPFTNRSIDLWKTLSNWLKDFSGPLSKSPGDLEFFLVTNRPVPSDCLAFELGEARTEEQLTDCITRLRTVGQEPSGSISKYVTSVLETDERLLRQLICQISVCDAEQTGSTETIWARIQEALYIPEGIDPEVVVSSIAGWFQRKIKHLWDNEQPAWITKSEINRYRHRAVRQQELQRQIGRLPNEIPVADQDRKSAQGKHFVEHLRQIGAPDRQIQEAIEDYLRFGTERTWLALQGEVLETHWDAREVRLRRRWQNIFDEQCDEGIGSDAKLVGRRILRTTVRHREDLAGLPTQDYYLTSGHYHRLAEVDHVWWHPEFKSEND